MTMKRRQRAHAFPSVEDLMASGENGALIAISHDGKIITSENGPIALHKKVKSIDAGLDFWCCTRAAITNRSENDLGGEMSLME